MNTYFRDGQVIKLVTPKGYNVNLPYATNGGMINTFEPDGTDDWKFVVIRTTNGVKFKRINTNHIITAQKFPSYNLAPLEAYNDVGGEDKYQTWVPIPSKPGYFNICLLAQQDQCMNVPRSTNKTKLTTYQRDFNDQDQWFSAVVLSPSDDSEAENFFAWAKGQRGISRYDLNSDYDGQCVTLIARYVQEVYLPPNERSISRAYGNGKDTASVLARVAPFNQYFGAYTNSGTPSRGAVISFGATSNNPYGHVAIVMETQGRNVRLLESNADFRAPNTTVTDQRWINLDSGNVVGWTNPR